MKLIRPSHGVPVLMSTEINWIVQQFIKIIKKHVTSEQPKRYKLRSCQKVCDALHYLFDNIFIIFGSKLHRQIPDIPMCTNCAPLIADLVCFVMRETSYCLYQTIIKLLLLKLLTPLLDI